MDTHTPSQTQRFCDTHNTPHASPLPFLLQATPPPPGLPTPPCTLILCLEWGCAKVHVHPEIATSAAFLNLSLSMVVKVRACCAWPCDCPMPRITLLPWHLAVVQGHDPLRNQCLRRICRGIHPCCPFWLRHHTLLQLSLPPPPPWQANHLTLC